MRRPLLSAVIAAIGFSVMVPNSMGVPFCGTQGRTLAGVTTPATERVEAASRFVVGSVTLGCPLSEPAGHPQLILKVVYWCAIPTPFHQQAELKFKVRVTNSGSTPLDLSQTHWRLLLTSFAVSRWVPPRIGQPTERPSIITYEGHRVWAVPANANRAYDDDSATGYVGFATHWDVPVYLAPGRTFFDAARYEGDLAYYVPETSITRDPYGNPVLHGFIGLAYVNNGHVIAVAPVAQWGKRLPAESF